MSSWEMVAREYEQALLSIRSVVSYSQLDQESKLREVANILMFAGIE